MRHRTAPPWRDGAAHWLLRPSDPLPTACAAPGTAGSNQIPSRNVRPLLHLLVVMLLTESFYHARRHVCVAIAPMTVPQPLCFAGSAPSGHPADHFAGTVIGAPFCFTKNTRNLAGFVVLAFRETVCTSSGDSWMGRCRTQGTPPSARADGDEELRTKC